MKRVTLLLVVGFAALWSVNSLALEVGVVNMQKIFRGSPQVKKINSNLTKQFASRKESIVKLGKSLKANLKDYQKNKAVMAKAKLLKLKATIGKQEAGLRKMQMKFQQDLFAAQNKRMASFMRKVKSTVANIAKQKKLDLVMPKNALIYAKGDLDITSLVISKLK